MAFGIPNAVPGSSFEVQVQGSPDSVDFDALALGYQGTGTVSGCAVTAGTGLAVAVAPGIVAFAGVQVPVFGGAVGLTAADATNPRLDLIVVASDGTVSSVTGTASATNPVFGSITGYVLLAAVYVAAAATTLTSAEVVDKRVQIGPVLLARVAELESRVDELSLLYDQMTIALQFMGFGSLLEPSLV